jgi:predicted dehydrogenase
MSELYNVLIIGAGNIGAFFDAPNSRNILTHAHGFKSIGEFNIVGFVDIDKDKAKKAADIWGGCVFLDLHDAFEKERIDVACVAVPDEYHYDVLKAIATKPIKLVFTEKPLVKTLVEANKIVLLYEDKNIPLIVNYTRRFVPEFIDIRQRILDKEFGNYTSGSGYYGKGILHNGSHMVDLLHFLLGKIVSFEPISILNDFYEDDPSVSATLWFENRKPFFMQVVDCSKYTIFELDLLFDNGRIRIINSGARIEVFEKRKDVIFSGYFGVHKQEDILTSINRAMNYVAKNVYGVLTGFEPARYRAIDAYDAMKVCVGLKEKAVADKYEKINSLCM